MLGSLQVTLPSGANVPTGIPLTLIGTRPACPPGTVMRVGWPHLSEPIATTGNSLARPFMTHLACDAAPSAGR
jgi:hypothetical protein